MIERDTILEVKGVEELMVQSGRCSTNHPHNWVVLALGNIAGLDPECSDLVMQDKEKMFGIFEKISARN